MESTSILAANLTHSSFSPLQSSLVAFLAPGVDVHCSHTRKCLYRWQTLTWSWSGRVRCT